LAFSLIRWLGHLRDFRLDRIKHIRVLLMQGRANCQ